MATIKYKDYVIIQKSVDGVEHSRHTAMGQFDHQTVRMIRRAREIAGTSFKVLAEEYGVCPRTIQRIVNCETYRFVS